MLLTLVNCVCWWKAWNQQIGDFGSDSFGFRHLFPLKPRRGPLGYFDAIAVPYSSFGAHFLPPTFWRKRYVRVLGAFYLRLVGTPADIYQYLEPLYNDYRKIKLRLTQGKKRQAFRER